MLFYASFCICEIETLFRFWGYAIVKSYTLDFSLAGSNSTRYAANGHLATAKS